MGMDVDRFAGEVDEDLVCPVCFGAAWQPHVVCEQDDHLLCTDCFSQIASEPNPTCPKCRRPFLKEINVSKLAKRLLEKCPIWCLNHDARCTWQGSISDEATHGASACQYRLTSCPQCHQKHTIANKSKHLESCPDYWIFCSRGGKNCGGIFNGGFFKRKNAFEHDVVCAQYRCVNFGTCQTRTTKANLVNHEKACKEQSSRLRALECQVAMGSLVESRPANLEKGKGKGKSGSSSEDKHKKDAIELSSDDEDGPSTDVQGASPAYRPPSGHSSQPKRIKLSSEAFSAPSAASTSRRVESSDRKHFPFGAF